MISYTERSVIHNHSKLYYYKTGNGVKPLFVFHGFGQDHTVFEEWARQLSGKYTLYLFDLYFHGLSTWPETETPVRKTDWWHVLNRIMEDNNIQSFSVVGFSLGGKFVFATLLVWPEAIEEVILLAPDGITISSWYRLATYNRLLRKAFESLIQSELRFVRVIRLANRLRLANDWLLRFAQSHMDTMEKRNRVYQTWVVFRRLSFNMDVIADLIRKHHISLLLFVGKYDRVIPPEKMDPLVSRLGDNPVRILDTGHNDVINAALPYLQKKENS